MSVFNYITIVVVVFLTSIHFRVREQLNNISKGITQIQPISNRIEVAMQPKWILYSIYFIIVLWLYLIYNLFQLKGWWSILYAVGIYFLSSIISFILPIPRKRAIIQLFYITTYKRIKEEYKYNQIELKCLNMAYEYLDKITTDALIFFIVFLSLF